MTTSSNWHGIVYKHGDQLNKNRLSRKYQLERIIEENSRIFVTRLERDDIFNHCFYRLKVINTEPIYLVSQSTTLVNHLLNEKLDELLEQGIIEYAKSTKWSSPANMKLINNKWELCVNYTELNKRIIETYYTGHVPNIKDVLEFIPKDHHLFSKIVLKDGYSQLEIHEASRAFTAFKTDYGHFQYTRMNSHLKNAGDRLQLAVEAALNSNSYHGNDFVVYLGQILVFSKNYDSHFETLSRILDCLNESNLKVDIEESCFLVNEVKYLGVLVDCGGLWLNDETIKKIRDFPEPNNITQLRSFLGLIGHYKDYCQDIDAYNYETDRLKRLLRSNDFYWDQNMQHAFVDLKLCFGAY